MPPPLLPPRDEDGHLMVLPMTTKELEEKREPDTVSVVVMKSI